MEKQETKAGSVKEFAELIGAFTKYGALAIGGLCLLLYSREIGQFPEGVGLGEGLAFYLVCAGFLIVYSLYVVLCTATGCLLLALPAQLLHRRLVRRDALSKRSLTRSLLHTDFSPMWELHVVALGLVGLGLHFAYFYFSSAPLTAAVAFAVPLLQGAGIVFLLMVTQRYRHIESGLLLTNDTAVDVVSKRKDVVTARRFFFLWLAFAPMLLTPDRTFLVDSAFRMAQLRKEDATVHIKAPWSVRVSRSTLAKTRSFMGDDYQEFKKVNVLLRSVGNKVVIEFPEGTGVSRLSIPADAIYVE